MLITVIITFRLVVLINDDVSMMLINDDDFEVGDADQ